MIHTIHQTIMGKDGLKQLPSTDLWIGSVEDYIAQRVKGRGWRLMERIDSPEDGVALVQWMYEAKTKWEILAQGMA